MVISPSVDGDVTRRWARKDATKMRMLNHQIDQDVDVSIMEESDPNSTPSLYVLNSKLPDWNILTNITIHNPTKTNLHNY